MQRSSALYMRRTLSSIAVGGGLAGAAYLASTSRLFSNNSSSRGNVLYAATTTTTDDSSTTQKHIAFDPNKFIPFTLESVEPLTHNVKRYRFSLPAKDQVTGMEVASCILVKANIGGKDEIRPYTPTSTPEEQGYFDLMIKTYPNGVMSKHIDNLKIGDTLDVKGPLLKFRYEPNSKKELGLIAGGTGLTPMYQLIRKILDNPNDRTKISMIYANVTPDDIMMKQELDKLQREHPDRFHLFYTVDRATDDATWNQGVGYVTRDMIENHLPNSNSNGEEDVWVAVCGPPPFMRLLSGEKKSPREQGELTGLLKDIGFTENNVFKF